MSQLYQLFLCCLFLCGCTTTEQKETLSLEVLGRSDPKNLSSRQLIYSIQIPADWEWSAPPITQSLVDTTEPLLTLHKNGVTVTFHNFPAKTLTQRIPPFSQIARWKNQFEQLDEASTHITPFSVAGFTGLQFQASGIQKGNPTGVIAWSMQLTPELFQKLPEDSLQQKADWTLKAVGQPDQIELLAADLSAIAKSIELLQEIPQR